VLLASVPPLSMYIMPTAPAGGVLWPIQASAHFIALASMHIGSGPGVAGLSGMQVQPLLPSRKVVIAPSAPAWTIVAPLAIEAGAAAIALWTGSLWSVAATAALFGASALPVACCWSQPARARHSAAAEIPAATILWLLEQSMLASLKAGGCLLTQSDDTTHT